MTMQAISAVPLDWQYMTNKPVVTVGDSGYATLAAAVTAIGATVATLELPPGNHVAGGVTIPATMHLRPLKGAICTVATGTVFTIAGSVEAGPYQIFNCSGTGKVQFTAGIREASVRWWGATGDGVTNDTVAMQAAVSAFSGDFDWNYMSGGTLHGEPRDTYLIDPVTWHNGATGYATFQHFKGNGATLKQAGTNISQLMSFADTDIAGDTITLAVTSPPTGTTVDLITFTGTLPSMNIGGAAFDNAADFMSEKSAATRINQLFYVIKTGAQTLQLARSLAAAKAGTQCTISAAGSGTFYLAYSNNFINIPTDGDGGLSIEDWNFRGYCGSKIWVTAAVTSEPTNFYFAAGASTPGTKRTTFQGMVAERDWYYDTVGKLLYFYTQYPNGAAAVLSANYPHIHADAEAELTDAQLYRYFNGACVCYNQSGGQTPVQNCRAAYVDKFIDIRGGTYTKCNNLGITWGNYAIYLSQNFVGINDMAFTNVSASAMFGPAVYYVKGGWRVHFYNCTAETYPEKHTWLKNCAATQIDKTLMETSVGWVWHGCTELFKFDTSQDIVIRDSQLGCGGSVQTCTQYFNLVNVRGLRVDNCSFDGFTNGDGSKIYLYTTDTLSSGITINNGDLGGNFIETADAQGPIAVLTGCTYGDNGRTILSAANVRNVYDQAHPNYYTNPTFASAIGDTTGTSVATPAIDATTGYSDGNSLKITWGTGTNVVQLNDYFTAYPAGSSAKVYSFWCKADAACTFTFNVPNNGGTVSILGDEVWRFVSIVGNYSNNAASGGNFNINAVTTYTNAKHLWIDDLSVRLYPTTQEAYAAVGSYTKP